MARRKDAPGNGELPEWFSTVPLDPDHYRAYITGLSEYLGCSEAELEITIDPEKWFRRRLKESAENCPVRSYVQNNVPTVHPADTEPTDSTSEIYHAGIEAVLNPEPPRKRRIESAPSVMIVGRDGTIVYR